MPRRSIVSSPPAKARAALRFMSNQFVIVGPQSDPANIKGMTDAAAALREIARLRAPFVSRGDNSGTHVAEQRLWQAAKVNPKARSGNWYRETGLGMGLTVQMAATARRLHADRPRHMAARGRPRQSSGAGRAATRNCSMPTRSSWSIPTKHAHVNVAAANAFIDWLIGMTARTRSPAIG